MLFYFVILAFASLIVVAFAYALTNITKSVKSYDPKFNENVLKDLYVPLDTEVLDELSVSDTIVTAVQEKSVEPTIDTTESIKEPKSKAKKKYYKPNAKKPKKDTNDKN